MRATLLFSLIVLAPLAACAGGGSKGVPAVVESESARQAAAAAQSGDSPDQALAKGEAAKTPQ